MTVIIGGLLVVSLLARPSCYITEKLAYKYILPQEEVHLDLGDFESFIEDEIKGKNIGIKEVEIKNFNSDFFINDSTENFFIEDLFIEDLMSTVMDKTRELKQATKQQTLNIHKLQSRLDLCEHYNKTLDSEKVDSVSKAFSDYENVSDGLEDFFQKIRYSIDDIRYELFALNTDKARIITKLDSIIETQRDTIRIVRNSNQKIDNLIVNF